MTSQASRHRGIEASRPAASSLAPSHPNRRAARRGAGFTLVEMVIVIGIVVLLMALTVGVITTLHRGSESRKTQDMLTQIDDAYDVWKTNAERDITYGVDGVPPQLGPVTYEIQQDTQPAPPNEADNHEATDQLLTIINKNAPTRAILANIDSELLHKHPPPDNELTAKDAWDTEILTVFPGRLWVAGVDPGLQAPDKDGTIRTEFEHVYGECTSRRVRFVSAGPDGKFGDLSVASPTAPEREAVKDNIYSYPLERP